MRLCPTVEGSPSPLITHRIGADVCQARQGTFFHKCHRCVYRGQAADWEPEDAELTVEIDREPGRKNGSAAPARGKKPAKPRRDVAPGKVAEAEA